MMTAEYMINHKDENLGWCKVYADNTGRYAMVMTEGNVTALVMPGKRVYGNECQKYMPEFAKAVNKEYVDYEGYEDSYIAIQAMEEKGCAACPFFSECDAMSEEMEG